MSAVNLDCVKTRLLGPFRRHGKRFYELVYLLQAKLPRHLAKSLASQRAWGNRLLPYYELERLPAGMMQLQRSRRAPGLYRSRQSFQPRQEGVIVDP